MSEAETTTTRIRAAWQRLSPATRARIHWVFVGSQGIRAGWSLLIFAAIVAVIGAAAHFALHGRIPKPKGELPPGLMLLREALSVALIIGVTAIMGRIEHRSTWSYGFSGGRAVKLFLAGWLGGLACLSLLVGGLYAGGFLTITGVALAAPQAVAYALVWLLVFLLVGISEEAIFRGYIQSTLARGIGFWPAAIVASGLFAAAHLGNPGETALGITGVALAGLTFCLLLRITGSLWLGIGFHTSWDWAQSYLYGTPDSGLMMRGHLLITSAAGNTYISGGSAGPEGSVLAPPATIAGLLLLVWLIKQAGLAATPRHAAVARPVTLGAPASIEG
jgi:membrane protease YdiL (CAAX protease family)